MEIFEIYCKIQNRLIFIMIIKDLSAFGKKIIIKDTLVLKLPLHWRSVEKSHTRRHSCSGGDHCNMEPCLEHAVTSRSTYTRA